MVWINAKNKAFPIKYSTFKIAIKYVDYFVLSYHFNLLMDFQLCLSVIDIGYYMNGQLFPPDWIFYHITISSQLSFSSFSGWWNYYQEILGNYSKK